LSRSSVFRSSSRRIELSFAAKYPNSRFTSAVAYVSTISFSLVPRILRVPALWHRRGTKLTAAVVQRLFHQADTDQSGYIDTTEFAALCEGIKMFVKLTGRDLPAAVRVDHLEERIVVRH
jgi:hypothetical protein